MKPEDSENLTKNQKDEQRTSLNKVYNTITEQIKVHKTYGKIGITPPESW